MKKHTLLVVLLALVGAVLACNILKESGTEEGLGHTIGDFVWEDLNANGIQDPDEPGIAGVRVRLVDAETGELVSFTNTDAEGKYLFFLDAESFFPNPLFVEFDLPPGYFFTLQDAGDDDALDSDVDPNTGQTAPFKRPFVHVLDVDAGMYRGFEQPSSAIPVETPTPTPIVITTTDGNCEIFFYGPFEAKRGGQFSVRFEVMCGGIPGTGIFFATLGDPPTDANATHAKGELDQKGTITLFLKVNWLTGTTTLFCSYEGQVYPVAEIIILE